MTKRNKQIVVRKVTWAYARLPRRGIGVRAVHHIFRSEGELRETNAEELPGRCLQEASRD
jgi:hypothetical protein